MRPMPPTKSRNDTTLMISRPERSHCTAVSASRRRINREDELLNEESGRSGAAVSAIPEGGCGGEGGEGCNLRTATCMAGVKRTWVF